jgi:SAM-dependent methyltransferase
VQVGQPHPPDNREHALYWVLETVHRRGLAGAVRDYATGFIELLRDLTPERRKSRYGDIDFDFEHGVDTSWATVPLRTRIREWLRGVQYQASEPQLFFEILGKLPVSVKGFTFIDLGSGKGRTLLMASRYSFRRILGVELLPELNAIAQKNVTRYKDAEQRCFAIESQALDAREFVFPPDPTVLYLFNPFPEEILRQVLANLRLSLIGNPRAVYIIYHNLVHDAVFAAHGWLKEIVTTHQYAIYEAVAFV